MAIDEAERIREVYRRHSTRWQETKYRGWMPGNLLASQQREREMLKMFRGHARLPLADQRILDVGCAAGKTLLRLLDFGARPKNLFGVDLLHDQIEEARTLGPHLHFEVADARSLPFEDGAFDLVLAFTLFSSIQTREIRQVAADEMRRVLRPGGEALVYDFRVAGWTNPDTRAIGLKELRELFRNSEVEARRLTLAPPIARMLAPRSWLACELLGQVPLLRTHWLAMVRPTD